MRRTWRIPVLLTLCIVVSLEAQTASGPATSAPAAARDPWPRRYVHGDSTIVLYQPQVEKWDSNRIEGRAAVTIQPSGSSAPSYGAIEFAATAHVLKHEGLVELSDWKITAGNFPGASDQTAAYLDLLRKTLLKGPTRINLARLEANFGAKSVDQKPAAATLRTDPPKIYFSEKPAFLILIDGQPILRPVKDTQLQRIVNTSVLALLDPTTHTYYLRVMNRWLRTQAGEGPLPPMPPGIEPALERAEAVAMVDAAIDLLDAPGSGAAAASLPLPYVSTTPAELIVTDGPADFVPISGTQLLWAKNTTGDLFKHSAEQQLYVLISGRWFRAKSTAGPWEYVAHSKLPPDFAAIPEDHPKADVLVSVAGTRAAREALVANRIPQTARIKGDELDFFPTYDGSPKFEPIPDTQLTYAVNTRTPVIATKAGACYAVRDAVWFTAAAAEGPWKVATRVPAEIYSIPPTSPLYYVTHVYVYSSLGETVTVGYTPGYFGICEMPDGIVVYGTGQVYPPYVGPGDTWYPRPATYGFGAGFCWHRLAGFGMGVGVGLPPNTVSPHPYWDPFRRTDSALTSQGPWGARYSGVLVRDLNFNRVNLYSRWAERAVMEENLSRDAAALSTGTGGGPQGENAVFAGTDNNVYRLNNNDWEQYAGGANWQRAEAASAVWAGQAKDPTAFNWRQYGDAAAPGGVSTPHALNAELYTRNVGAQRSEVAGLQAAGGWGASLLPDAGPINRGEYGHGGTPFADSAQFLSGFRANPLPR